MSRYENKYNKVYDKFKECYISERLKQTDCDTLCTHLNHHADMVDKGRKNNKELTEKCLELKVENKKLKNNYCKIDIAKELWCLIKKSNELNFTLLNPTPIELDCICKLVELGIITEHHIDYCDLGINRTHKIYISLPHSIDEIVVKGD